MVGFLDSGIGGVFVLRQCLKICPNHKYFYLADNKNLPFGNKSKKRIIKIAIKNCSYLSKKGCVVIVFACNTLTAVAIKTCRKQFPNITFVGIEPAIKPALKKCKNILVLCTKATFAYSKLIKKYQNNKKLTFAPQKHLAEMIENNCKIQLENVFDNKSFDAVVLGCTHYNFIKNQILNFVPEVNIFEASDGVARRLSTLNITQCKQKITFHLTGEQQNLKNYYKILKNG